MTAATVYNLGKRRQFQALFSKVWTGKVTLDPVTLDISETVEMDVTGFTGVALGDIVLVGPVVDVTEVGIDAQVTAANTVTLTFQGADTGNVNLASSVFNIVVLRIDPAMLS